MSKTTTVFLVALLLCSTVCSAARPQPTTLHDTGVAKHQVKAEESCQGIGEEECLMRRTLTAHLDYIYTQQHNP
ncbi:hypothetical protein Pfo_019332 [Paulownia fortunei]|nr:hypothetical protein Pfo_019332 [Paulownia fortunei]